MKFITALAMVVATGFAHANEDGEKAGRDDGAMFKALNIMAVPIGEKGMVVKDNEGCLWVLKNGQGAPMVIAVLGEEDRKPLCDPLVDAEVR